MTVGAPEPLGDHHVLDDFNSGVALLDDWLKIRARANASSGASKAYVACEGNRVAGYYALSTSAVAANRATGRFRRNMPDPIPVVVLGRLAIDLGYQGQGLGRALFRDAAYRVLMAADVVGIRGLVVDAISEDAKAFYLELGMAASPLEPMMLMVTMADLKKGFEIDG